MKLAAERRAVPGTDRPRHVGTPTAVPNRYRHRRGGATHPIARRLPRAAVGSVMSLLLIAACGLRPDSGPREIKPVDGPTTTAAIPNAASQSRTGARIYLIDAATDAELPRLAAVRRDVAATPAARLNALFEGVSAEERVERLRTAIPPGAKLLSAEVRSNGRRVVVDVSEEFLAATDEVLTDAVAQIVYTASELDGVVDVQIYVAGRRLDLPRGDRTLTDGALSVFDFPGFRPSTQPPFPAIPTATAP